MPQRDGEDFTGPSRARLGLSGLVCPCYRVRSAPAFVVEDVLQLVVLLPLLAPMTWCDLVAVSRSATVYGSGGCSLPRDCCAAAYGGLFLVRARSGYHGETTMMTSRPRWRMLVGGKLGGTHGFSEDVVFWGREKSLSP